MRLIEEVVLDVRKRRFVVGVEVDMADLNLRSNSKNSSLDLQTSAIQALSRNSGISFVPTDSNNPQGAGVKKAPEPTVTRLHMIRQSKMVGGFRLGRRMYILLLACLFHVRMVGGTHPPLPSTSDSATTYRAGRSQPQGCCSY